MVKKFLQLLFVVALITDAYLHYKTMQHPVILPEPEVIVTKPIKMLTAEYITQTGTIVAYNSVNLVARIKGYLESILFTDGTFVKKGDPLFVIEPSPYAAKLREANAQVAAQKAIYSYDSTEHLRQQRMYKENATSLNNVQKWLAKSEESVANVNKALANAEIEAINYSYTHLNAPFDGRIGRHMVDVGNLVGNGAATVLATIDQLNPIYIYFNLNELDFIKLRTKARARGYNEKIIKQVPIAVSLQNDTGFTYNGHLDFVNTGLNASTGTMEFRALLPNDALNLLPGLFVQIRITVSDPAMNFTVPATAVLYDQIGPYLLVTNKNRLVKLKRVQLGSVDKGRQAILQGLAADDLVIIAGLQNASPGHRVVIKENNDL